MRRLAAWIGLALLSLGAVLVVRAARLPSRQAEVEPAPRVDVDTEAFTHLARSIREVFPGTVVVPYLALGGSDARHYTGLSDSVYRFGPYIDGRDSMQRAHGTNERIPVEGLGDAVRFYRRLIRNSTGAAQPSSA